MPDIVSGYNYVRESLYKTPRPRGQSSFAPHIDKAKPKSDEPTVRTPSLAYQAMAATWTDIDVIRGGTKVIRDAGELYLPQEPGEATTPTVVGPIAPRLPPFTFGSSGRLRP